MVREDDPKLKGIDVVEHLGESIPLDLRFADDAGDTASLGNYFHHGKPVVLVLAYYECPMLCTMVLNGLSDAVRKLDWLPGREFQVLTVSINPAESSALAAGKKSRYLDALGKPIIDGGWRFFVGDSAESRALANALGFQYYYDEKLKQYAHPAVVFILTQDGKISRYLYGLEYKQNDLRMALLEAAEGKIGNTFDRLILYCYHYDPNAGSYVLLAGNVMKLGGLATLLILGVVLGTLWTKERTRAARNRINETHERKSARG